MHQLSLRDIGAGLISLLCVITICYQSAVGTEPSSALIGITTLATGYFIRGAENGGILGGKHSGYTASNIEEKIR